MQFKEIIGQEKIKKAMIGAVLQDRVPHALMIIGKDGNGSLPLAIALSAFLNCTDRSESDSCGECNSCKKHKGLIHPDLHFVFPTFNKGSNPASTNDYMAEFREMVMENKYCNTQDWKDKIVSENKALNINTKQCREMIKSMSFKTFEGEFKVMVLWLPEYLKEQGNILLKMIEEPAPKTVFMLCTSESDKILTTILSRTQLLHLQTPTVEGLEALLVQSKGLEKALANNIALLADGSINRAFKLLDHVEDSQFGPLREWLQSCFKGNVAEMSKLVNDLALKGREDLKSYLQYGMHILRACIVEPYKVNENRLTPEEGTFVANLSKFFAGKNGEKAYECFNNALYWVERNGNVKIVLFDLSLELNKIFKNR